MMLDAWVEVQLNRFIDNTDLLQDELDLGADPKSGNAYDVEFAIEEIKIDMDSIKDSVTKLESDIAEYGVAQIVPEVFKGFETVIAKYEQKIETELKQKVMAKLAVATESSDAAYSNANLRTMFGTFCRKQKQTLEKCGIEIIKKLATTPAATGEGKVNTTGMLASGTTADDLSSLSLGHRPREQVYLEKTKPPKFNGDELEFPEFKRKWLSQVNKANLPEETELDKLRDAVPKDAKDQLYGVTALSNAWEILEKRYGDKLLISKKLKTQLKGVQCVGKSDPERIINLKIKVRNIVTRLEALNMGAALTHDSEFLSAVYCALPDRHRTRWLDYEKGTDHWAAMLTFLDRAYEQANQELALLSVYKDDKSPKVKTGGAKIDSKGDADDSRGGSGDNSRNDAKKRAKENCGKCPACSQFHFQRKDGVWWPSDRFISCKKFRDMNVHQRSEAV